MVRRPFCNKSFAERQSRVRKGFEKSRSFLQNFSKKYGKVLTSENPSVFLETFPLKRKRFFEIYFVRLIGTPNQKFQTRDSFSRR